MLAKPGGIVAGTCQKACKVYTCLQQSGGGAKPDSAAAGAASAGAASAGAASAGVETAVSLVVVFKHLVLVVMCSLWETDLPPQAAAVADPLDLRGMQLSLSAVWHRQSRVARGCAHWLPRL